jgi:cobalt/nickel transport protein
MDMGKPEQFFVISSRGKGKPKQKDLLNTLEEIAWNSPGGKTSQAYETTFKARGGDHIFYLSPKPYFEKSDNFYIKQNTKVIVNVGGEPGAWSEPIGVPTEIVPLNKPYDRWTGNVFQGLVLFNGEPVANAEIEIEYLNHKVLLNSNSFEKEGFVEAPQDSFILQTIFADANGIFTFGIPRAGWWGFAALDLDPDYTYNGKKCSRDAVIWLQAKDMK